MLNQLILTRKVLKDTENTKGLFQILTDLVYWYRREKRILNYLIYGIQAKGKVVSDYITDNEFLEIHNKLNSAYIRSLLEDKNIFDDYFRNKNFPVIGLIGLIEKEYIFWKETHKTEKIDDLLNHEIHCFCKSQLGFGGKGVFKLDISQQEVKINNVPTHFDTLKNTLKNNKYVLQKSITNQHPAISALHSSSVNTIRTYTINDGLQCYTYTTFIRIGRSGGVIDNVGAGNLFCGIHENGQLYDQAREIKWNQKVFTKHPDSSIAFASVTVPFFKEAKEVCIKMHEQMRYFFIIGWDIAITEDGPKIIEGNPVAELECTQILYGPERKRFHEFAEKFKERRFV